MVGRVGHVAVAWLIVLDVVVCTLWLSPLYVLGWADRPTGRQIVSSYVGKGAVNGRRWALRAERVIDAIFWWDPGHCRAVLARERLAASL